MINEKDDIGCRLDGSRFAGKRQRFRRNFMSAFRSAKPNGISTAPDCRAAAKTARRTRARLVTTLLRNGVLKALISIWANPVGQSIRSTAIFRPRASTLPASTMRASARIGRCLRNWASRKSRARSMGHSMAIAHRRLTTRRNRWLASARSTT